MSAPPEADFDAWVWAKKGINRPLSFYSAPLLAQCQWGTSLQKLEGFRGWGTFWGAFEREREKGYPEDNFNLN